MANDYDAMPIDDFFSWKGRTATSEATHRDGCGRLIIEAILSAPMDRQSRAYRSGAREKQFLRGVVLGRGT
jgi:hypothetical protein